MRLTKWENTRMAADTGKIWGTTDKYSFLICLLSRTRGVAEGFGRDHRENHREAAREEGGGGGEEEEDEGGWVLPAEGVADASDGDEECGVAGEDVVGEGERRQVGVRDVDRHERQEVRQGEQQEGDQPGGGGTMNFPIVKPPHLRLWWVFAT